MNGPIPGVVRGATPTPMAGSTLSRMARFTGRARHDDAGHPRAAGGQKDRVAATRVTTSRRLAGATRLDESHSSPDSARGLGRTDPPEPYPHPSGRRAGNDAATRLGTPGT
jgi:hypothetical protein